MNETMTIQESLTLNLTDEMHVRAPLAATFEALLAQLWQDCSNTCPTAMHLSSPGYLCAL